MQHDGAEPTSKFLFSKFLCVCVLTNIGMSVNTHKKQPLSQPNLAIIRKNKFSVKLCTDLISLATATLLKGLGVIYLAKGI